MNNSKQKLNNAYEQQHLMHTTDKHVMLYKYYIMQAIKQILNKIINVLNNNTIKILMTNN